MKLKEMKSETLGWFRPDPEPPGMPILISNATWQGGVPVDVCLAALKTKPDWPSLLRRAETLFPLIQRQAEGWLQSKAEDVLQLHRDYFGDEWKESGHALLRHLAVANVNFTDDGTVELWYDGDDAFHCLSLNLNLDKNMKVVEVRFDG